MSCGIYACNSSLDRRTGLGHLETPRFATVMEEPAQKPDAKARNRRAAL
jgi:hypothetical protein